MYVRGLVHHHTRMNIEPNMLLITGKTLGSLQFNVFLVRGIPQHLLRQSVQDYNPV